MKVGFNVVAPYYGGSTNAVVFANLMWQAERWQYSSGFWANQDQGITTGNPGTQTLYSYISDGTGLPLPAGTYTFRNPDGNNVALGFEPGGGEIFAFSTSTAERTFTLTQGSGLCVTIKGDATNTAGTRTGGLQIILPGHKTSWDAGDYFNSAWVSFHQNAKTQMFRFMDWLKTNNTIATDWANRATINKITLNTADVGMPWEVIISAANRFNKPAHINVSARATDAYVTSLGALLASTYTPSQVFVEYGNETWNYANIFSLGFNWVNALTFTKKTVAVNPTTGLCTSVAHGWSNDNLVHTTISHAGRALNWWAEDYYYYALWGGGWYVKVLTADTFELWTGAGGTGTKMDLASDPTVGNSGISELIMWNEAEAGKTLDNGGNVATRTKQIADILDAALPGKLKVIMGSQSANSGGVTVPRLANATTTARIDYLATAPYYNSIVLGGAVDRTTNTFTPKVWSYADDTDGNIAAVTCYFGVYAQGSTPTIAQVIAGTGTGFVAKPAASWTHTYSGNTYASGGAVTVVNGTTYSVFFVVTDPLGCTWMWSQVVAAANVTDTVDVLDTNANQLARALYSLDATGFHNVFGAAAQHKALIAASANPAIQLMAYECNSHENYSMPAAVNAWHEAWMGNASYGGVMMTHYLEQMAAAGFQYANIFLDVNGAGPWGVASDTYDTTDGRYLAVAAFNGGVPVGTAVDLGPVSATRINAAPGSYPYVAYTFADATLTYSIQGGNNDARWDISGATVRLLNSTGINYASGVTYVLKMQSISAAGIISNFDLTMSTGPVPWYESDALIAWNSVTDTDNAAINPDMGAVLALTAGAGATISGGMWDCSGSPRSHYGNGSGMTAGIDFSKPLLVAVVLDVDNGVNFDTIHSFGAGSRSVMTYLASSSSLDFQFSYAVGSADYVVPMPAAGTKRVAWFFFDAPNLKIYYGYNQTESNTAGGNAVPGGYSTPSASTANADVGDCDAKFGSFEVVNRTGMDVAAAKAIVQKLQTIHSIP